MSNTVTNTDLGFGLGIAMSIVALVAALGTAYFGYAAAMAHEGANAAQLNSALAFGVAVFAGAVAVAAFHAYDG